MKSLLKIIIVLSLVWSGVSRPTLSFDEGRRFKILQLTDLHYGLMIADVETHAFVEKVLDWEKPDLVVLSGDVICGKDISVEQEYWWSLAVVPMEERKIPWAMTFGNHDDMGRMKRPELMRMDMKYEYSLSQAGPSTIHGVSNYFLRVLGWNSNDTSLLLWMLDSGDNGCLNVTSGWGCIEPDQVQWFRERSLDLAKERPSQSAYPSLAFFHIPLVEYQSMFDECPTYGFKQEHVCAPEVNTNVLDAFRECNVKAVGCGHDHDNSYWGFYKGVQLNYGRKSGWGYYNPKFHHGARVWELREEEGGFSYSTWIRQSDASIILDVDESENVPSSPAPENCKSSF